MIAADWRFAAAGKGARANAKPSLRRRRGSVGTSHCFDFADRSSRAEPQRARDGGHTYLQVWGASDCVVTDWAPWSPCSVSCGAGERMRLREASECRRC